MRHKTTQALYSYWNGLRGPRLAPRRFEIEPGSIGDILPDTFILERHDAATFPYRLAGTRLCERFKREFRGQNFLSGWTAAEIDILRSRLNAISVQGGAALFLLWAGRILVVPTFRGAPVPLLEVLAALLVPLVVALVLHRPLAPHREALEGLS